MKHVAQRKAAAKIPGRVSYLAMALLLGMVGWQHLATPLLCILFSYLALTKLQLAKRCGKWLAVSLFLVFVSALTFALVYFINQVRLALPEIVDKAIPSIIQWARQFRIELPFADYEGLMNLASDKIKGELHYLSSFARFARGAVTQVLFLVAGVVIGISLFLNPRFELGRGASSPPEDLYSLCSAEIGRRFGTFFQSFSTVMGAQVIISAINSALTAIFVLAVDLPYAVVVVGVSFFCGLLPVIGNLVSNTVVVAIGFTVSPKMAFMALVFLVLIHKLEYLLNSTIVSWRIRNPLWLTLVALILGERLFGVSGMILAPVVLHYIRLETSQIRVEAD